MAGSGLRGLLVGKEEVVDISCWLGGSLLAAEPSSCALLLSTQQASRRVTFNPGRGKR